MGEFKEGKADGQGEITFFKGEWEGDKYVGGFKDGKKCGQGTYTEKNGNIHKGEYKNDYLNA